MKGGKLYMRKFLVFLFSLSLVFALMGTAWSLPINLNNASFEEPALGEPPNQTTLPTFFEGPPYTVWKFRPPAGETTAAMGIVNPPDASTALQPLADNGQQFAFINTAGAMINQWTAVEDTLKLGFQYDLMVDIGARVGTDLAYELKLFAGEWNESEGDFNFDTIQEVQSLAGTIAAVGWQEDVTLSYLMDNPDLVGYRIGISLRFIDGVVDPNIGGGMMQIVFDDVRLDGSPVVPEPGTMLLFGTGLVGLAGLGRRKFFKK
jgi:hypothetical protein